MSATKYTAFFQHLTATELAEERARIIEQLKSFFDSQGVGSKTYTRSAKMLEDRLQAVGIELSRRSASNNMGGGVTGQIDWNC